MDGMYVTFKSGGGGQMLVYATLCDELGSMMAWNTTQLRSFVFMRVDLRSEGS